MVEVLISRWDGEKYDPAWHCTRCGRIATVIRDGFTGYGDHRYLCINCLEGMVGEIKKAILNDKIAVAEN